METENEKLPRVGSEEKKVLGDKLKAYRKKRGWSQKKMAKLLGSGKGQADISRYEKGHSFPSSSMLIVISRKIGVDQFFSDVRDDRVQELEEIIEKAVQTSSVLLKDKMALESQATEAIEVMRVVKENFNKHALRFPSINKHLDRYDRQGGGE